MPFFGELELFQDNVPRSAALNMALDEALLEMSKMACIRFYQWDHPALSFGYFGRFAEVADYAPTRDLVRRWTGGGIVFHGEDLTYSIVIPSGDERFGLSSKQIYEAVHRALCEALKKNGQPAELSTAAASNQTEGSNQCFANPVTADVMLGGSKVAGAAHRKTRYGLLHQGSIHVRTMNGLAGRFARGLSEKLVFRQLAVEIHNRAGQIAKQKYATEMWLRKR